MVINNKYNEFQSCYFLVSYFLWNASKNTKHMFDAAFELGEIAARNCIYVKAKYSSFSISTPTTHWDARWTLPTAKPNKLKCIFCAHMLRLHYELFQNIYCIQISPD